MRRRMMVFWGLVIGDLAIGARLSLVWQRRFISGVDLSRIRSQSIAVSVTTKN